MRLMELKEVVSNSVRKKKKGKNLKAESIQTVLKKLEAKEKEYDEQYAKGSYDKSKKKLEYHRKVVKAQIKKARDLLADME